MSEQITDNNSEEQEQKKEAQDMSQMQPQGLDKNRKVAVIILACLAFFMFFFWSKSFKDQINQPFSKSENNQTTKSYAEADSEASLRAKDTDGDGLSDWDELNVYGTSPYLEDSDSDGFSDYEEILSGNDPNCAIGSDCQAEEEFSAPAIQTETLSIPLEENALQPQNSEAQIIRQLMIEAGFDKNTLDQVSDEELIEAYQASLEDYDALEIN